MTAKIAATLYPDLQFKDGALWRIMDERYRSYVHPQETLTLTGAQISSLAHVFGGVLSTGVQASHRRKEELDHCMDKSITNCVTMEIVHGTGSGGWLDLFMELRKGCMLGTYLYNSEEARRNS